MIRIVPLRITLDTVIVLSAGALGVSVSDLLIHRNLIHANCVEIEALKKIPYDDLSDQIRISRRFLKTHPHGIPGFVTAKQIERDINHKIHVRAKYAPSHCP